MITELKNVSASSGWRVVDEQADVSGASTSCQAAASSASRSNSVRSRSTHLADALVVEADPLLHRQLRLGPGRALEALLRPRALVARKSR